ncbi:MAG: DegV family protein [Mycobacteriaceae bacterium]|uniref:DegV family protein n=1 Tax=Corynebacterium sp. TaxID=1720 RepID=UPI003F97698D
MTVRVVTDASSCLPDALAAEYGIEVLDFHAEGQGDDETTAGLGALELTARYARLLERGGDEGVVAVHISKELSGTWSAACQAAAVLDGLVEVIDSQSGGMVVGQAAIAAARCADDGGSLDECRGAAQHVIDTGHLWIFLSRMDSMARGGRLSAGQRLLSTALAIKPILHLTGGKLELAARTRTQAKAMERLVVLAADEYRAAAGELVEGTDDADTADGEDGTDGPVEPVPEEAAGDSDAAAGDDGDTGNDTAVTGDGGSTVAAEPSDEVVADADPDSAGASEDEVSGDEVSGRDDAEDSESGDPDASEEDAEGDSAGDADDADDVDAADADDSDDADASGEAEERPRIFKLGGRDKAEKAEKTDKTEKPDKADKPEQDHHKHRRHAEDQVPLADLPRVPMHLAVHHYGAEDTAEELRVSLREVLPECVVISVVDISHAMAVHTGPGAIGVSLVRD